MTAIGAQTCGFCRRRKQKKKTHFHDGLMSSEILLNLKSRNSSKEKILFTAKSIDQKFPALELTNIKKSACPRQRNKPLLQNLNTRVDFVGREDPSEMFFVGFF